MTSAEHQDDAPLILLLKATRALDSAARRTLWERFRGEIISRCDAWPVDPDYDRARDAWLGRARALSVEDRRRGAAKVAVVDIHGRPFARGKDFTLYLRQVEGAYEIRLVMTRPASLLKPDLLNLASRRRKIARRLDNLALRYPELVAARL